MTETENVRRRGRRRCSDSSFGNSTTITSDSNILVDITGGGERGEGSSSAAVESAGDERVHSDKGGAGEGLYCFEEEQDALGSGEFEDEGERV